MVVAHEDFQDPVKALARPVDDDLSAAQDPVGVKGLRGEVVSIEQFGDNGFSCFHGAPS